MQNPIYNSIALPPGTASNASTASTDVSQAQGKTESNISFEATLDRIKSVDEVEIDPEATNLAPAISPSIVQAPDHQPNLIDSFNQPNNAEQNHTNAPEILFAPVNREPSTLVPVATKTLPTENTFSNELSNTGADLPLTQTEGLPVSAPSPETSQFEHPTEQPTASLEPLGASDAADVSRPANSLPNQTSQQIDIETASTTEAQDSLVQPQPTEQTPKPSPEFFDGQNTPTGLRELRNNNELAANETGLQTPKITNLNSRTFAEQSLESNSAIQDSLQTNVSKPNNPNAETSGITANETAASEVDSAELIPAESKSTENQSSETKTSTANLNEANPAQSDLNSSEADETDLDGTATDSNNFSSSTSSDSQSQGNSSNESALPHASSPELNFSQPSPNQATAEFELQPVSRFESGNEGAVIAEQNGIPNSVSHNRVDPTLESSRILQPNSPTLLPESTAASQVVNSIKTEFTSFESEPTQTVSLTLNPPELGQIQINVEQSADQLIAHIIAAEFNSSELLLQEKDLLMEALGELGYDETSLDISYGNSDESDPGQEQENTLPKKYANSETNEQRSAQVTREVTGVDFIA